MMPTSRTTSAARRAAAIGAAAAFLAACGSGEPAAEGGAPPAETSAAPSTSAATTQPTATTAAPTTTAPATTAPTTVAPTTTEGCGLSCPLTPDQQDAVDAFFEAYDGSDWDALLATTPTDEPEWSFGSAAVQSTELMRYDFVWADALNQVTTIDKCFGQGDTVVVCLVQIEDDIHRLFEPYGMTPSSCKMAFDYADGLIDPRSFNAFDCFGEYDLLMHIYGGWSNTNYPDDAPFDGVHYRGWNQTDEAAARNAAEHLDEWGASLVTFFEGGGTIGDLSL